MILRGIPLRDLRWESEKGSKVTVARAGPLPPPGFDNSARGLPERLLTRKYERLREEEEDEPDSDNVIDFLSSKREYSGKDE